MELPTQLLRIRLAEASGDALGEEDLFGARVPPCAAVLEAIERPGQLPAVLLVDELDRADHDFEAVLLEMLADAAVTVPELGTIRATIPPAVVLTSNRTRDLHDALNATLPVAGSTADRTRWRSSAAASRTPRAGRATSSRAPRAAARTYEAAESRSQIDGSPALSR